MLVPAAGRCSSARPWRTRAGDLPLLVLAGYALVVAPWAVRNTRLQGVVDDRGHDGRHQPADGQLRVHARRSHVGRRSRSRARQNWSYALAPEHPGRHLTEGQKDKWAQRKAIEYMRAHPGTTLRVADQVRGLLGTRARVRRRRPAGLVSRRRSGSAIAASAADRRRLRRRSSARRRRDVAGGAATGALHVLLLLPVVVITGVHTWSSGTRGITCRSCRSALYAAALLCDAPWRRSGAQRRPALVGATADGR